MPSMRKLIEVKEKENICGGEYSRVGKTQILRPVKKIKMLIFVSKWFHLKAFTAKNSKVYTSFKTTRFFCIARDCFSRKILGGPSVFYCAPLCTGRCKRLQKPRAQKYTLRESFLLKAQLFLSFDTLLIFLYTCNLRKKLHFKINVFKDIETKIQIFI